MQSVFQFIPKLFCAGHSSSSSPVWAKHVFIELSLCTGASSCWDRFQGSEILMLQHTERTIMSFHLWGRIGCGLGGRAYRYFWPYSI